MGLHAAGAACVDADALEGLGFGGKLTPQEQQGTVDMVALGCPELLSHLKARCLHRILQPLRVTYILHDRRLDTRMSLRVGLPAAIAQLLNVQSQVHLIAHPVALWLLCVLALQTARCC